MRNHIFNALKGMAMGMAEVVPGVSGGTLAFITGIYPTLMESISSINATAIKMLSKGQFKTLAKHINLPFILALGVGMFLGIVSGVLFITYLLENFPLPLWGFFFGLIVASALYIFRQINPYNWQSAVFTLIGAAVAYFITVANPLGGSEQLIAVFFSGVIAISAMVLPGLSGSFILLLLGMYAYILPAVKQLIEAPSVDIAVVVGVFALGCLVGLLSFARLMSYAFKKQARNTLAILLGFMIGSLNKVWPWQQVTATRTNSSGEEVVFTSKSILPSDFSALNQNFFYGTDSQISLVGACMALGFVLVLGLDFLSKKKAKA